MSCASGDVLQQLVFSDIIVKVAFEAFPSWRQRISIDDIEAALSHVASEESAICHSLGLYKCGRDMVTMAKLHKDEFKDHESLMEKFRSSAASLGELEVPSDATDIAWAAVGDLFEELAGHAELLKDTDLKQPEPLLSQQAAMIADILTQCVSVGLKQSWAAIASPEFEPAKAKTLLKRFVPLPSVASRPGLNKMLGLLQGGDAFSPSHLRPLAVAQAELLLQRIPQIKSITAGDAFTLEDAEVMHRTLAKLVIEKEWAACVAEPLASDEYLRTFSTSMSTGLRSQFYGPDVQAKIKKAFEENSTLAAETAAFLGRVPEALKSGRMPSEEFDDVDCIPLALAAAKSGDSQLESQVNFLSAVMVTASSVVALRALNLGAMTDSSVKHLIIAMSTQATLKASLRKAPSDLFKACSDDAIHVKTLDGQLDARTLGNAAADDRASRSACSRSRASAPRVGRPYMD